MSRGQWLVTYSKNNRSRSDDCVMSDFHPSFNDNIIADVNVLTNVNFSSNLRAIAAFEAMCVGWCLERLDGYASTNLDIPSDSDPSRIEKLTMSSNCDVVADRNIVAIVAVERCGNIHVSTKMSTVGSTRAMVHMAWRDPLSRYNQLEVSLALPSRDDHRWVGSAVVGVDGVGALGAFPHQLLVVWQKWLSVQHLLLFGLVRPWLRRIMRWLRRRRRRCRRCH